MKNNGKSGKLNSKKVTSKSSKKLKRSSERIVPKANIPFRFSVVRAPSTATGIIPMRDGSGKKNVDKKIGTLDNVIQKRHIFKALSKMPNEIQSTLLDNGWIGKSRSAGAKNKNTVLSLHKNVDRVKTVIKRYHSGLIWMNYRNAGLKWSSLDPGVLVNRFPRDRNAPLKLCALTMAGKSEFDHHYPRAYRLDEQTTARIFVQDYTLTACASLLSSFVGNDGNVAKVASNGQVPIITIHFAIRICNEFILANGKWTNCSFTNRKGENWKKFFDYYHQVVHDGKKFLGIKGSKEILDITKTCLEVLENLRTFRPQMSIDGFKNVWIIKCQQRSNKQPLVVYKMEDVSNKLQTSKVSGYIIQKYIETPLLNKNSKFNVHAWVLVSTIDKCLTVWVYRTCCIQFYVNKFSMNIDDPRGLHSKSNKVSTHAPVITCQLNRLKGKLRSLGIKKTGGNSAVCSIIKKSIVTSVVAAVDVLNWRPNCFELFEATFVLDNDLHPWLIDIKSDPCLEYEFNFAMSALTNGIAKDVAKVLMMNNRTRKTEIGKFDLIHKSTLPKKYKPRVFVSKPITIKRSSKKQKIRKIRAREEEMYVRNYDDNIKTYIEDIHLDEDEDYQYPGKMSNPIQLTGVHEELADGLILEKLNVSDLTDSMSRIIKGNKVDVYEAKHCLGLLEKWKNRVLSTQQFCKRTVERSMKYQAHKNHKR